MDKKTQADGKKNREKSLQTETNIGVAAVIQFLSYSAIYGDKPAQTGREKNESTPR